MAKRGVPVRELVRGLKALGVELPHGARAGNQARATIVLTEAKRRAEGLGGVAAHVAPSLRTAARENTASVLLGGKGWPMAGGAEFGAYHNEIRQVGRRPHRRQTVWSMHQLLSAQRARGLKTGVVGWNQFRPYRRTGYFLFPAKNATLDAQADAFLGEILKVAGPQLHLGAA